MPRTTEQQRDYMRDYRSRKKAEELNAQTIEQIRAVKRAVEDDQAAMEILPDPPMPRKFSRKEVAALDDVPMFPTDREQGLPRSNYFGGSFADGIQRMPQKKIDAILDRVNIHKGREHR